ncbi:MAG: PAS domain-containing protein [Magnetospirillum sp.]|nr:PAS domain-containing protein [Magnetospirillum sp.]
MRIKGGILHLSEPSMPLGPKPSIDRFFTSLAEECGFNAIGVILSGTGTDGSHGIRALKAHEGFTVSQEPDSAKYDGMPKAAIDTGCVDRILKPDEMGRELEAIAHFPRPTMLDQGDGTDSDTLRRLFTLVRTHNGIDFSQYKTNTINRRLERRLAANRIETIQAYLEYVRANPAELDLLCKDILISVTSFFRDPKAFEDVRQALSEVIATKHPGDGIRLWVTGCATGEEAYSFAFMLHDLLGDRLPEYKVQIFATDIDTEAMVCARRGLYPETALVGLPRPFLARYLDRIGHSFQVRKEIREMMVFARQDLAKDPPFLKIDLISCRNILIYFNAELQDRVLRLFHYALNADGYLFLGKSESVGRNTDLFRSIRISSKVFQRRLAAGRTNGAALLGLGRLLPSDAARDQQAQKRAPAMGDLVRDAFIAACMPPSVAVNDDLDIQYVHGDVKQFLKIPEGAPTHSLVKVIDDVFRADLRALAYRAKGHTGACLGPLRCVQRGPESDLNVRLVVRSLPIQAREQLMLVSWEKAEPREPLPYSQPNVDSEARTAELEQELTATREHLQTVVEELETSNEELQAVNEELQAANEELQSSNEELETSNEELQATNEELTTVNQELQVRSSELAEANADLINIQDNIGFPLVVVDHELRLTRYSPQAVRLFGMLHSDIGQPITALPNHLQIASLRERLRNVIFSAEPCEDEIHYHERILHMRIVPCRDQIGRVNGAALTFVDETEVRRARRELEDMVAILRASEEALRTAKEAAEHASRAKSAFLARMSHELRTPMNAVLGFTELLVDEPHGSLPRPKQVEYLHAVQESGIHLLSLIEDLLDISRIEAGGVKLHEIPVDLGTTIGFAMEVLGQRAAAGGVALAVALPDRLPRIRGDETAIRRVLINIVGNAVKFTPPGGRIDVQGRWSDDGLQLVIADTGIGIAAEDLARIMEPFEQARTNPAIRQEGVGLGLPIANSLMTLHGGSIRLSSNPTQGTMVTLSFPADRLLPRED